MGTAAAPAVRGLQGGPVRISISARTAFNLDELNLVLKKTADRLGHPACYTGCDFFQMLQERVFIAGEKVELNPQPLPPGGGAESTLTVSIPGKVMGDISRLTKAVGLALGKLGCQACCSGFDILFRREIDGLAIDEKLNVAGFGKYR